MKNAICFDWDGTLADSMNLCMTEVAETLRRMGLPVPPEDVLRQCNGPTYEACAPLVGVPKERLREYMDVRLQVELSLCTTVSRLFPGIRDMLERLSGQAALCVVSNGLAEYLDLCLRAYRVDHLFQRIEAGRPGRTKAQALADALAAVQPERALMVGDRLGDLEAGKACGIPTVAACYGYGTPAEWAAADLRAATVGELERLLLDWVQDGTR